ncbi:hypothetical protein HOI83_03470 [Candidatus Uhrbacteria bacterium]|nr:hypothetical protein [Candidatus Uhrbacteria bacterium]
MSEAEEAEVEEEATEAEVPEAVAEYIEQIRAHGDSQPTMELVHATRAWLRALMTHVNWPQPFSPMAVLNAYVEPVIHAIGMDMGYDTDAGAAELLTVNTIRAAVLEIARLRLGTRVIEQVGTMPGMKLYLQLVCSDGEYGDVVSRQGELGGAAGVAKLIMAASESGLVPIIPDVDPATDFPNARIVCELIEYGTL